MFAVHGLSRALMTLGHEVEVFTTNINGFHGPRVPAGEAYLDGVRVTYFDTPFFSRLSWSPSMYSALNTRISEFGVVHLHSVFLWPTWAAARAARRAGVPYILSPRGMLVKSLVNSRNRVAKSMWMGMFERNNLEQADAIHTTSDLEAADLSAFGWQLPRVITIPNGFEEVDCITEKGPSAEVVQTVIRKPYTLYLGRLSWKKGLDRLLDAFSTTTQGFLVIAGTDDEGLSHQLCARAKSLGIANRVSILPRTVLGADKEHLYRHAQLFVLASYSENFGNTVLEAMGRGIPVVVTPEVGAAEIVRQSGAGLVCPGDIRDLGNAIDRVIGDAAFAAAMGEAGKQYIQEFYRWPIIARRMEALYQSVVPPLPASS
jgi:glycosyltransferase involved in cell wall biosynthesis